jgi:hypothetical protein
MGPITLAGGNSAGEQPYDLRIGNTRRTQIAAGMRAEAIRGFDRGNQRTTLEFKVSRRHGSAEEAQVYAVVHAASLKNLGNTLSLTMESSGDVYVLEDAVIGEVQSTADGIVSIHSYGIVGGNFRKE